MPNSKLELDPSHPTFLMECGTPFEAAAVKGLLAQHGIDAVIQSENLLSQAPYLLAIVAPRLLVLQGDLERAREVVAARPETSPAAATLEGAVCPVHEQAAIATCARCGSFLCNQCEALGDPAVCEGCLAVEALPERNRSPVRAELILMGFLAAVAACGFIWATLLRAGSPH